jgi:hypothetical protein
MCNVSLSCTIGKSSLHIVNWYAVTNSKANYSLHAQTRILSSISNIADHHVLLTGHTGHQVAASTVQESLTEQQLVLCTQ